MARRSWSRRWASTRASCTSRATPGSAGPSDHAPLSRTTNRLLTYDTHLGVPHWSARLLADHLGISFASVARIWREWDLQPWRRETFRFSTDPQLEAKIRDVVGLYLNLASRSRKYRRFELVLSWLNPASTLKHRLQLGKTFNEVASVKFVQECTK